MTAVVYARLPEALKEDLHARASERGLTINRALAERARHQLASCPRCRQPLRGSDFLVSGHCPNEQCDSPLSSLLTPTPKNGAPEKDEYLALLGALGALVGLALATPEQGEP